MKTTVYKLMLIALCLLMPAWAMAQTKVELPDNDQLAKELEDYMGVKGSSNKEMKEDVSKFCGKILSHQISDNYRSQIVELMNGFIKKRATPTPHMHNLVRALNGFWDRGKVDQFMLWANYISEMTKQQTISMTKINEEVAFMANLLSKNSIEVSSSKSWYMNNGNFKLSVGKSSEGHNTIIATFAGGDLRCRMREDSSLVIYNTSGSYNFGDHTWSGKNGKVDWRRGNLSPDSIYAELSQYEIITKSQEYSAKNVKFYNRKYFSTPIVGDMSDKLVVNGTGEKARYPQFKSKSSDIVIKNLAEDIDYKGGYAQNGVLFQGEATDSSLCQLIFKYKDEPFIIAESQTIVFGLKRLESENCKVTIKLKDGKKISHPGVKIKYNSQTGQTLLFKGSNGMENAVYEDNYHNLSIDANQVEWMHNDTTVYFCTRQAAPRDYATFESSNYFSNQRYNQIMGMDRAHPLIMLRDCSESMCCKSFTARDFMKFLQREQGVNLTETQVHQMLMRLSFDGYIEYNIQNKTANLSQKTYDYIACHGKHRDYDAIFIKSNMKNKNGVNASLSLNTYDLVVYNAEPFDLSAARMVKVLPDSAVIIHAALDMDIRGKIQAGLSDFYGKDFKFNYNKFVIDIPKSDSMAMLMVNYNEETKKEEIDSVKSVFENITGTLMIDEWNNKSGAKERTDLPRLITNDTSHVYYDNLISADYDREKFYMEVHPFTLDSMNFLSMNGVKAKGRFVSGIFPDLDVTLTVQEDQSLGFDLPTPEDGYELYGGKGKFFNRVALNAEGLIGDGDIHYLTAVAKSDKFKFFPDSVEGHCKSMVIAPVDKGQIGSVKDVRDEYPDLESSKCDLLWSHHNDKFSVISPDTALALYGKSVNFNGKVDFSPYGMKAAGELLYFGTGTFSDDFKLRNSTYYAGKAIFCNHDPKNPGDSAGFFYTDRYNTSMDFNTKKAEFRISGDSARVHFPQHKYKQLCNFFEWDLAHNSYQFGNSLSTGADIVVRNQKDYERVKKEFNGVKPLWAGATMISNKDSLRYDAYYTAFHNEENIIHVHEPGEIPVVDSKIDPSGIINIMPGGSIDRFENAVITANRDSTIHRIINTTVKIRDKYYFKAIGGQYEYHGANQGISYLTLDSMEIRRIKLDTAASAPKKLVSFGIGSVKAEEKFMLNPQFMFEGKYSYMGATPGIKFNGFSFIQQTCDSTVRPFKFEGNINPDNVVFPVSEKVIDQNKQRLYTGFFFNEDSACIYQLFMGHKWNIKDSAILAASKGLTYNDEKREFRVAPRRRLNDSSNIDNYVVLYKGLCDMYGEGAIKTNVNLAPLQMATTGEMYYNRQTGAFSLGTLLTLNFHVNQDALKIMTADINDCVNLNAMYLNGAKIRKRMEFVVGNDTVKRMLRDYSLSGEIGKIPQSLSTSIVIGDMKMYWDTTSNSYKSQGPVGVTFINGTPVNKYMKGYVEILHHKRKGDQITIYLEPTRGKWFYFNYNAGFMYCLSSNEDFNNKIINVKDKERIRKIDKIEYQYVIGAAENKNKFLKSFNETAATDLPDEEERSRINQDIDEEMPIDIDTATEDTSQSANGNISAGDSGSEGDDDSDFVLENDESPEDDSHSQPAESQESSVPSAEPPNNIVPSAEPQNDSVPSAEPQNNSVPSADTQNDDEEADFVEEDADYIDE